MEKQAFIDLLARADIADTETFALQHGAPHEAIADYCKSLLSLGQVSLENITHQLIAVNAEGKDVAANGSPEARVLAAVQAGPKSKKDLEAELGASVVKPGFGGAMKAKLVALNDEKNVAAVEGAVACGALQTAVKAFEDASNGDPVEQGRAEFILGGHFTDAKKRKLLVTSKFTSFKVTKTASFTASAGQRKAAELTKEELDRIMKLSAEEQEKQLGEGFKALNLNSCGARSRGGHLHPLLKVRSQIRDILLHMGFSEMKTNNFVESGFWNFDTLFQPQQHPARDAHDTFFLSSPESTDPAQLPHDYVQRVKEMHERGGHGSIGWRYDWSLEEACKNILRTHTTAVSARTLYQVAQEYKRTGVFKAQKFFSIDRVFRNETLDATHLAEFHQVEGLVADRGLGLGHLIGTIKAFFARMGINKLRFKPAYNPYTEPSLEIFGYHPMLKKWVEVGNSGVFRPEMLMPMGLPEDVRIIAWGISVERPTMIQYGIPNIRELFGHQLDVEKCAENPICWYKEVEVKEG